MDPMDPARFSSTGHAVLKELTLHLMDAGAGKLVPVMPLETPREMCEHFDADFPEAPADEGELLDIVIDAIADSTALHSPRFVGHQVAVPFPEAALCDLVAALLNNGMAVFEMGPAASAMERSVLAFFARVLGLPATSGGVLTSGGSIGNLTALLAARQKAFDAWHRGIKGGPQLVVVCADGAHYSVARAARILGLGDAGVVTVPVDERLRMIPSAVDEALAAVAKNGSSVMAVVANAGATTAGSFDPLEPIADICQNHRAWLHVDGAHGASLALSRTRAHLVKGIERADSVVWDAHKMLGMPALVTAVLFRDARAGAAAFAQDAGYLFEQSDDDGSDSSDSSDRSDSSAGDAWSDIGKRTIECTKRAMSLKLYACLKAYGVGAFRDHVDRLCDLSAHFARVLKAKGCEVLVEPEANIVVFRRKGDDGGQVAAIRKRILKEGRFYLVQVRRPDGLWLRTAIMNPRTTEHDLEALVDDVMRGP
jgi:L-2,4-diaminobutyrate decarboxylase